MDENSIRLECLRLAVSVTTGESEDKVATARRFADFVLATSVLDRHEELVRAATVLARTVARSEPGEFTASELQALSERG